MDQVYQAWNRAKSDSSPVTDICDTTHLLAGCGRYGDHYLVGMVTMDNMWQPGDRTRNPNPIEGHIGFGRIVINQRDGGVSASWQFA